LTDLAADDPTSSAVRVRVYLAPEAGGDPAGGPGQAIWVSMDDPQHRERKVQRELQNRVAALEQIEMFAHLSPDERQRLAEGNAPGAVRTRRDHHPPGLRRPLAVRPRQGGVRSPRPREGGAEKLVARIAAPNVFGRWAS